MMKARIPLMLALGLVLALGLAPDAGAAESGSCLVCHNVMSGTATLPSGAEISLRVNAEQFEASVHSFLNCTDCHQRFSENPHVAPADW